MSQRDETMITEITIGPDGRVFVFGLSRGVLDVLAEIFPREPALVERLSYLHALTGAKEAEETAL